MDNSDLELEQEEYGETPETEEYEMANSSLRNIQEDDNLEIESGKLEVEPHQDVSVEQPLQEELQSKCDQIKASIGSKMILDLMKSERQRTLSAQVCREIDTRYENFKKRMEEESNAYYTEYNQKLREESELLKTQLKDEQETLCGTCDEISKCNEMLILLKGNMSKIKSGYNIEKVEIDKLQERCDKQLKDFDEIRDKIATELPKKKKQLEEEIEREIGERREDFERQKTELKNEIARAEIRNGRVKGFTEKIEALREKISAQKMVNEKYRSGLADALQTSAELDDKINLLDENDKVVQQKLIQSRNRVSELQKINEEKSEEYRNIIEGKIEEIAEAEKEIDQRTKDLAIKKQNMELTEKLLSEQRAERQKQLQTLSERRDQIKEEQEQFERIESAKVAIQQQLEEAKNRENTLKEKIAQVEVAKIKAKESFEQAKIEIEKNAKVTTEELQKKIADAKNKLDYVLVTNQYLKDKMEKLENEFRTVDTQHQESLNENGKLKATLAEKLKILQQQQQSQLQKRVPSKRSINLTKSGSNVEARDEIENENFSLPDKSAVYKKVKFDDIISIKSATESSDTLTQSQPVAGSSNSSMSEGSKNKSFQDILTFLRQRSEEVKKQSSSSKSNN